MGNELFGLDGQPLDTFELEAIGPNDYLIPIKYYPEYVATLSDNVKSMAIKKCKNCHNETDISNLFMVYDLRIVCNLCLPIVIQQCKAEAQYLDYVKRGLI